MKAVRRVAAIGLMLVYVITGFTLPKQQVLAAEISAQSGYVDEDDTWAGTGLTTSKSMVYFHDGKKSLRLRKENVLDLAYADNPVYYAINKGTLTTDFTLTWDFWYRSKESDGFVRMDITLYDANRTQLETLTGNRVMLSRSSQLSEWTKASTYAVVSGKAAYATFRIYVMEGYNQVWVDDISMRVTETYYEKLVETCDFHAVTEKGTVAEWEITGGSFTAPEGVGIFTAEQEQTLSFCSKALVPGYTYQVQAVYTASQAMTGKMTYYNAKWEPVGEDVVSLAATTEESILLLETTAADATYGVFGITGTGSLTIDDFCIYQDTDVGKGENGWNANVIWYPENASVDALSQYRYFRTTFQIEKEVERIYLQASADDDTWGNIFYNCTGSKTRATQIASKKDTGKKTTYVYDLTSGARQGKNVLAIRAHNVNSSAGLIFELYIHYADGTYETIYSRGSIVKTSRLKCLNTGDMYVEGIEEPADWYTLDFDDSDWVFARNLGVPPYCDMKIPSYFYGYAPRFELTVAEVTAEQVTGGKEHTTVLAYTGTQHTELMPEVVEGQLYQDGELLVHIDVAVVCDGERASFTYTIPDYLPAGAYELKLRGDGVGLLNDAGDNILCNLNLLEPEKEIGTGSVELENGAVRLKINGQNESPIMYLRPHYTSNYYDYDTMKDVKDSGINLYVTYNGMLDGRDGSLIWTGEDTIDYAAFDAEIYRTLDLNPNAMLIANIGMDAPQWWTEANPTECITDEDGNIVIYTSGSNQLRKVSFASKKYREEATEVVRKLVEHMQSASYRNRICGIRLIGGRTFEWMQYNSDDTLGTYPEIDYSEAMKTAFLEDTGYEVPSVAERSSSIYGTVLNPQTQQNIIAYNTYLSQCTTDSLLSYAQAVKETEPNWLVGAYYGYLWFENSSLGIGGCHTTAEQVLDSPYVDFIASPVNYSERVNGYKTGYMAMSESVAAHGKLYMLEQDNRTLYSIEASAARSDNAVGLETTMEGTFRQLTRDMTTDFVKGNGFWFYDMEGGWFSDSQITDAIRTIKEEYDIAQSRDLSTNSQVAVYVGSSFYNYLTADLLNGGNGSNSYYLISQLYNQQRLELAKMGTSYDTYVIEDLCSENVAVNWEQYKLHIVLSPLELGEEERDAIEEKIKKNGNVILWVYLPGISDGQSFCGENLSDLIDMDVEVITGKSVHLTADITDAAFGTVGESYGIDFGYSYRTPYAVVEDDSVTSLATYTDTPSYVAAAKKDCGTYTSVYSGVSNVSAGILRNLCEMAGVHLYTEDADTVIETNAGYISVYSQVAGEKSIVLDEAYQVYDVLSGKMIGNDVTCFTVNLKSGETGLYRLDCIHQTTETTISKATISRNGAIVTKCVECKTVISNETINAVASISLTASDLYANGKTQKIGVLVKDSAGNTIAASDYTVSGTTSAVNPGTYRVTVTLKGEKYQGKKTLNWSLALKGTSLKSVGAGSKRLTVKWKKQAAGVKGYKIQVSTEKNFKKNVKTVAVKKAKTTSKTIKNLKGKKKYYVRICTYNGKYTSKWSAVKTAKTKK